MHTEILVGLFDHQLGFRLNDSCRFPTDWTRFLNRKRKFPHDNPPVYPLYIHISIIQTITIEYHILHEINMNK